MSLLTADQALGELASINSVDGLIRLAKSVDANVGNSKLILYGGQLGDVYAWQVAKSLVDGNSVKWIENAEISKFLKDPNFTVKLAQLAALEGKSPKLKLLQLLKKQLIAK